MAWDLWSSSYDRVSIVHDGNYSEHPGWQCDFYFGCGHDVIEEDALNEKSCVQVLRILLTKADIELEELEKDLLSLQNELTCAENEKWPEICCSALSEKINWLDVSLRTSKNDHADDSETQLLLHNKPAQTLPEIVKDLQRDYCQDIYGQKLLTNALVRGPDLGAVSCAPGHSDGMKLLGADLKVIENEEVRRSHFVTRDTIQTLSSFSSKSKGNTSEEAKQENAVVKDVRAYSFGIKGRKKCLGSRLGDSRQAKSGNSDLDKKLCDFALKTVRRVCKKESAVAPAEYLDSKNSPLQVVYPKDWCLPDNKLCPLKGNNSKNSAHVMIIKNARLINAENSVLTLTEMQTKNILYTGSQLTDEEKPKAQGLKSETSANHSKSNMSLSLKLKKQGKRKLELDSFSDKEPGESPMEVISNTSLIATSKRWLKSSTGIDGTRLNKSLDKKISKRAVQPHQHETGERATVLYDSKFCELRKKRKVSKLPVTVEIKNSTNMDLPNSDRVAGDKGSQADLQVSRSYSLVDSRDETSALLPIMLKDLTLGNLRALAKQHNVKRYYRLPKGALVEQLVDRLSSC